MIHANIDLPADLRRRAEAEAERRGMTLRELIEAALRDAIAAGEPVDPMLDDEAVYAGPAPSDLSSDLDRHLYGEAGA